MDKVIKTIIAGIIASYTAIKISGLITGKKNQRNKESILIFVLIGVIIGVSYIIINNFLKVIIIFVAYVLLNRKIYKESLEKSVTLAFIEYINMLLSECLIGIALSVLLRNSLNQSIDELKNSIILNIVIMTNAYILAKVLKEKYKKIINEIKDNCVLSLSILTLLILICIGSLFYKIEIINWNFNSEFLLNAVIIVIIGIVGILIILQKTKYEKVNKQYKDLAKYSEINAGLLENYRILNHEHENQLIIIKGMFENNDQEELKEYLEQLIHKKEKVKYKWIRELNNLSFQELRSFISYKILEMETKKLKTFINISKKCKKCKLEKLKTEDKDKIYSVIGIFIDNAMEAAQNSKKREIIIDGYEQDGKVYLEIANTYNGLIDLNKINEYGYTNKGIDRGTGLYIVKKITEQANILETKTTIRNNYFVQTLIINNID